MISACLSGHTVMVKVLRASPLLYKGKFLKRSLQSQKFSVVVLYLLFYFIFTLEFLTPTSLPFHSQKVLQLYLNLEGSCG